MLDTRVTLCTLRESHACTRRTFQAVLAKKEPASDTRPTVWQFFAHQGPDEEGNRGEAFQNPDRDTDRSLTQWLMVDYLRHLSAAPPHAALDYLRESFAQILDRPAWTVREPQDEVEREMAKGCDEQGEPRVYIVTGCRVPDELLDVFCHAAERLLSESPRDWRAVAESPTPELDTREVPLEAPAGTPTPLKEAYESVAKAIFDAAEMRRAPPTIRPMFEEAARDLSAMHGAARDAYKAAET